MFISFIICRLRFVILNLTVCLGPESVFACKKELLYRPNLSLTNVKQRSLLAFLSILFVLCMLCNSQLYWCCKNGIVILKFLFVRVILTLHWFKHCFRYLWVLIHAGLVLLGLGGGGVWGFVEAQRLLPQWLPQQQHLPLGPPVPAPSALTFLRLIDTNIHAVHRFLNFLRLYDLISLSALKLEIKFCN